MARASEWSAAIQALRSEGRCRAVPGSRTRRPGPRALYRSRAGRIPFRQYAASWQASQVHRPTTATLVDSQLRNHVLPYFGDRPLASIRPSDVQAWVKGRSVVLSPNAVKVAYRFVSAIFRSAVRDRIIAASPCERIKLPRIDRAPLVPLETDAVFRLAAALPTRYRATVVVAAGAGLRQGEVFGLQVRHVDFLARIVRVEQQLITAEKRHSSGHQRPPPASVQCPFPTSSSRNWLAISTLRTSCRTNRRGSSSQLHGAIRSGVTALARSGEES